MARALSLVHQSEVEHIVPNAVVRLQLLPKASVLGTSRSTSENFTAHRFQRSKFNVQR